MTEQIGDTVQQKISPAEAMEQVRLLLWERFARVPLAYTHSYGCQQNASDTEVLRGVLEHMGCAFTDDSAQADLILMNTCAVRENAQHRVLGNVGALKHLKEENPDLIIILCGCMTQQPQVRETLKKSYPYVDIVFGANAAHRLPEHLVRFLREHRRVLDDADPGQEMAENLPVRRESAIKAWLPIMQGCDNFCTYCIVPYVRGRERSRTMRDVLHQARTLIQDGCREITLLGQNVNSYGKGLSGGENFPLLLRELDKIEGDFRIRFMTSHPKDCTRDLIDAVADCPKVCGHIHLPVQSGSDRILQQMNRRYTVEQYRELIAYARQRIPGVSFTSDIIVGFPGETQSDFLMTLALIQEIRFTSLYTFIYSRRSGTKAALLPDPVGREEKSRWFAQLLDAQECVGRAIHDSQVGKTLRVLTEGPGKRPDTLCGRTESGIITQFTGDPALVGRFADVSITEALNWALVGRAERCAVQPEQK